MRYKSPRRRNLARFSSIISKKIVSGLSLLILAVALPITMLLLHASTNYQQMASASGTTYFVSRNGNNADGLSWSTAWSDLNKINWSIINPGDTIVIDGGATTCPSNYDFVATRPGVSCGMLYNSTLTIGKSGTITSPITIALATDPGHNGTAVFFGGRATPLPYCGQTSYAPQAVGTGLRAGIVIGSYQYVVLDGGKRSGFMIYGYDDPTQNTRNGDGLGVQFISGSANNITVRNMEIFDNGVYDTFSGGYNSDSKGIQPMGNNLTFERLLVHDNGQDAFQSGGPLSNLTIQDSWMYERRSNPLYPGFSFNSAPHLVGCTHVDGIQVYGGGVQSGLTLRNDIFGPLLGQGIYPSDTGTYFNNVSINNVLLIDATENNVNSDSQSSGGPQNWSMQNITSYQVPGGAEPGWNTNLGVYSSTSSMSLTNSIVDNGNVQLSGFTGSGNINYNSDPVPGSTTVNPQFVGPLPPTNLPSYDTLVAVDFTPQCTLCAGKGSSLHSVGDLLNDIDQLDMSQSNSGSSNGTSPTPTTFATSTPTPTSFATPTSVPTNSPTPISTSQTNMIQNSSFENTGVSWLSPWIFQKTSHAKASILQSTNAESGSVSAMVSVSSNTKDWYVQLLQPNLSLVAGKTYTISFWAKTGANTITADVVLQSDHGSYPVYLQKYMSLNTAWQMFTYTFTANASDTNADLGFNLGTKSGNYYIDNVSMVSN